jgi:hypothetical protein
MLLVELEYAGFRFGIKSDRDLDMMGLGLEYAGIGIGICWD